eukprot:scaffold32826_cov70-Phaeocystis_antarctica.AAC.3
MVVHHSPVPQWVDTARREQQRGVKAWRLGLRPGGSGGKTQLCFAHLATTWSAGISPRPNKACSSATQVAGYVIPSMRNGNVGSGGGPSLAISGCSAENQPPMTPSADIAKVPRQASP